MTNMLHYPQEESKEISWVLSSHERRSQYRHQSANQTHTMICSLAFFPPLSLALFPSRYDWLISLYPSFMLPQRNYSVLIDKKTKSHKGRDTSPPQGFLGRIRTDQNRSGSES